MRRVLVAAVLAFAFVPQAWGGIAEVRDAHGHLVSNGGQGAFGSLNDAGWTLRYDYASSTTRGVLLRGVSLVGGLVYADRIFVPAHGLRGARVSGLVVNGHAVRATYLYAGAADIYGETGDESLLQALAPIWQNLVSRKLYITGGCGALIALYRAAFFYGTSRWIAWTIWAHVIHHYPYDLSWGGPHWVPAAHP